MKALKTTFYLILIPILLLILSSCGTKPVKTDPNINKPAEREVVKQNRSELENSMIKYKHAKQWSSYLKTATKLWEQTDKSNQLAIEEQIWKTLAEIPEQNRLNLLQENPNNIELADWFEFIQTTKLHPINQKTALADSIEFNPYALFNTHLSKAIIKKLNQPSKIQNIAVLLPLSGNYRPISLQIRNGMIKNKLLNHPKLILRFYDSSNTHQIRQTYSTALADGADFVIGPVKKETIQFLTASTELHIKEQNILVLNNADLPNFTYQSNSEALQIAQKLKTNAYQNIAVLASTKKSDAKIAQDLSFFWSQDPANQITVKTYPKKQPNLRKALASVINEKQSSDRKNNLRWLLQKKLHFTPRPRQDLDALVLLGNARQVAVFKPQLSFFNLKTPIYSSASLTPAKLKQTKPNKDLRGVNFPTYSAMLKQSNLASKFEAFGWDSLTIATHQSSFAPQTCLNKGMTGRLMKDGRVYDRRYQWAKYNRQGIIK